MEYQLTFAQYQQGLEQGKLLGLRCHDCQAAVFPSQGVCPGCQGRNLEVAEMKGTGILRTFTVIRVAPEGREAPYVVAMAELEEGPWVMGNLVGVKIDSVSMELIGKKVLLGSQPAPGDAYSDQARVITFTLVQTPG